jgi:hypothetical protein
MVNLDEAIKIHVENERKCLNPLVNKIIQVHTKLHIRIFEQTPRDSKMIERLIATKEKEMEQSDDIVRTQRLWTEIQALQRLLVMVQKSENGKPLDGVAY